MSDFKTVAKVGDIPEGEACTYNVFDHTVAVFLNEGKYNAIDDFCPHMGASLAGGYCDGETVTCPWHAWRFCIKDGGWDENPKIKVDAFDVRVQGNEIQLRPRPE